MRLRLCWKTQQKAKKKSKSKKYLLCTRNVLGFFLMLTNYFLVNTRHFLFRKNLKRFSCAQDTFSCSRETFEFFSLPPCPFRGSVRWRGLTILVFFSSSSQIMRDSQWYPSAWNIVWKLKFDKWTLFIHWSVVTVDSACTMIRTNNEDMECDHSVSRGVNLMAKQILH